ncbi:hypothetical protein EHS25_005579 [Saitozyma podzolica]|uniref:superoxide dismutase n=1 Tax=Saitozyma podzolica TaxID=1890683 RepID=A0A427XY87_9TREE|nr:hypothetical protein EHS25_005579 [Saitozyma podzolica]
MLSASLAAAELNEGAVAAESGLKAVGRCASERKRSWEDGGGGVEGERAGYDTGGTCGGARTEQVSAIPGSAKKLEIVTTSTQDRLLSHVPILAIDIWEHAFYLQYKNLKPDFLKAIWQVINFEEAEKRFKDARQAN